MTSWWKKSENMTVETSTLKTPSRNRDNTHTQNMNPRFYISIFFHHNDTVVDAQIFKIFEHHQSILYVFLGQNLLICSSPARILLCKFLKELLFAQNSLSFKQNTSNVQYLSTFWFLRLHYTTCFGNLEEMTHNLNLRNIIFFTFWLNVFSLCQPILIAKFDYISKKQQTIVNTSQRKTTLMATFLR